MFDTFDIGTCVSNYPKKLIVTLGKRGVIYNNGEKNIIIPSPNIDKVEDTTGAGDTFNGNLVSALIQGNSLYDSIVKAQFAASMKIKVKSAQNGMPYKEELEKYIEEYKKSA